MEDRNYLQKSFFHLVSVLTEVFKLCNILDLQQLIFFGNLLTAEL